MRAAKYKINHVLESLHNGQFKQAKKQLQKGCKTKPERQAYKLAQVTGALCDSQHPSYNPDLAVRFINLFDNV